MSSNNSPPVTLRSDTHLNHHTRFSFFIQDLHGNHGNEMGGFTQRWMRMAWERFGIVSEGKKKRGGAEDGGEDMMRGRSGNNDRKPAQMK